MSTKRDIWLRVLLVLALLVVVNIISSFVNGYIDLTEDKRFTLTEPTVEVVNNIDEYVYIKVLLDGEFPAGFKRLQTATKDLLDEFKGINNKIQFVFEDPTQGDRQDVMNRREELAKLGIVPTSLQYYDGTQTVTKAIYPFAIINLSNRQVAIPLLEEQQPGVDENIILNNSVSLLEYKFADALQKVQDVEPKNIVFTKGNGELPLQNTYALEKQLRKFHNTGRIDLDSVTYLSDEIDLLIIAAPTQPYSLKDQFKIDQYLMNGGKIIWLIESLDADLDSISKYKYYVPRDINHGLGDLLFKYGVRIQPNLILDLESTRIPQIVGMQGDKPQTQLFTWPYHPAIYPESKHPIVKNLDRINMFFPSSIDTIKTEGNIKKTILLRSSPYSRLQFNPVRLNFEILKSPFDPANFTDGYQPVSVLLEGEFESAFKNRVSEDFKNTLKTLDQEFKSISKPTKQLIVSDVDFTKSLVNSRTQKSEDIGFNKWEVRYFKGNKDFINNAVEYMLDEKGVLQARSKEIKLRLLDKVRTKQEKSKWQAINIGLPLLFLFIFGILFNWWRKKKYTTINPS
jgi:gliding-associated putative ABC transporter substrate-binding component GldG